jgi:glutamyl-tRNA reductase
MKVRKNRPLLLIDIAVPRDIDPEVNLLNEVYLFNIDDLQQIANDYLKQRREEIARCEAIIQDRARALLETLRRACKDTSGSSGEIGGCTPALQG